MNSEPRDDLRKQIEALHKLAKEWGLLENLEAEHLAGLLNSSRPKIMVPGDQRELIDFARECGAELKKHDRLFRRDRTVVVINKEKGRLDALTPRAICSFAQRYIMFFKFKTLEKDDHKTTLTVIKNIGTETAGKLLESWEMIEQLPEIVRLNQTRLPIIRADGRIELLRPGYFEEQKIFTLDDGLVLDEEMTLADAKRILDDLLRYFPFPNERSKSVAIAALLTMFCATMLPKNAQRPGFIYTANSPGAGKTLLAKVAIIPVVGSASTRTLPRKEEARKVLDVAAIDASNYILFDNIRGVIAGEEIEAFITSPIWEGRVLGESTKFRVENIATVFLTGNESTTSEDMQERCMFVELFVQEADNRERTKKIPNIIDDKWLAAPENRSRILSALWALVRDWDANGRKPSATTMSRFDDWSKLIGGIIVNAGYSDPLAVPDLPNLGAIEGKEMKELVKALVPIVLESDPPQTDTTPGAFAEWKFPQIIARVVELGLFSELEVRRGKQIEDMFQDGEMTQAGRSHFGKMLLRYHRRIYEVHGALFRFVVEGKGNSRKFKVVCEQQLEVSPF
jgi:hypothetical protein